MTEFRASGKIGNVTKLLWMLAGVAVLWAAAPPQSTAAQDWTAKRITPAFADSACIGKVSDPVCAVETWIACYAREDSRLCAALGVDGMKFTPDVTPNIFDYVIVDMIPVTSERMTPALWRWGLVKPGQLEVRVMKRWCTSNCKAFEENHSFAPSIYFLNRDGNAWRLAAWTNDVSVTCYYADAERPPCKHYFYDEDTPWVHDWSVHRKYR